MTRANIRSPFQAELLRPRQLGCDKSWAYVVLPKSASDALPRRGRTTVVGEMNGHRFTATLEPDGQLGHWLRVTKELQDAAGATAGDLVILSIKPVEIEPEPEIPTDLENALAAAPEARRVWCDTTTIARVDWIHWITSAKQPKTRAKRINDACDMLASGKRRVCCFDSSGFYSKAFKVPEAAK